MKRIMAIMAIGLFLALNSAQAQDWVEVGPTSMPAADFQALQKMISGQGGDPRESTGERQPERMIDLGMATVSSNDFDMLTKLLGGRELIDQRAYAPQEKRVELGVASFTQSEFESLDAMVRQSMAFRFFKEHKAASSTLVKN